MKQPTQESEIQITCEGQAYKDIDELQNFQGSLKKLPNKAYKRLKHLILKYGFSFLVFVWKGHNEIIDGHQRIFVTQQLLKEGYSIGKIPIVEIEAKDKTELAEKLLALNSKFGKMTEAGMLEFLTQNNVSLQDVIADLQITDVNLHKLLIETTENNEEKPPEATEEPVIKVGDIIELGEHRLLCGDATNRDDVKRLMNGDKADMILTDPPYNVNIEGKAGKIINDNVESGAFYRFILQSLRNGYEEAREGATHYVSDDFTKVTVITEPEKLHSMTREQLIEEIKKIKRMMKTTVLDYDRPRVSELHPTMKPVDLLQQLIENSTQQGWIILDLFGGSGSTMIAAETMGRRTYMMEYDPKYAQVIIDRWTDHTKTQAIKINGKQVDWTEYKIRGREKNLKEKEMVKA